MGWAEVFQIHHEHKALSVSYNSVKYILSTILFFSISFFGNSQTKNLRYTDYYRAQEGLASSELWLNNDSTFFLMYADCTSSDISKGTWSIIGDTLVLSNLISTDTDYKLTIEMIKGENDSLRISVQDLYMTPAKFYGITFFNQKERPVQLQTDENGRVTVQNRHFEQFTTAYEELNFEIGKSWDSCLHKIDASATALIVTMNYPEELLSYRIHPTIVSFKGVKKFLITNRKTLIDCNNKAIYKRKSSR